MNSDYNGTARIKTGEEHYEEFNHPYRQGRTLVQYDYRSIDEELFSTVAPTLTICRERRDAWLNKQGKTA